MFTLINPEDKKVLYGSNFAKNAVFYKDMLCFCNAFENLVKNKAILLIDDVKTTGATLNNCAKALKRAGATSVVCVTLASTPEQFVYE